MRKRSIFKGMAFATGIGFGYWAARRKFRKKVFIEVKRRN